jgi:hypothetical protein
MAGTSEGAYKAWETKRAGGAFPTGATSDEVRSGKEHPFAKTFDDKGDPGVLVKYVDVSKIVGTEHGTDPRVVKEIAQYVRNGGTLPDDCGCFWWRW